MASFCRKPNKLDICTHTVNKNQKSHVKPRKWPTFYDAMTWKFCFVLCRCFRFLSVTAQIFRRSSTGTVSGITTYFSAAFSSAPGLHVLLKILSMKHFPSHFIKVFATFITERQMFTCSTLENWATSLNNGPLRYRPKDFQFLLHVCGMKIGSELPFDMKIYKTYV